MRDRDQLIVELRPIAYAAARGYYLPGGEAEDLVQEAFLGIIEAVRDYNPTHGTRRESFAFHCARRKVIDAVKAATREKHRAFNHSLRVATDHEGNTVPSTDLLPSTAPDAHRTVVAREELAEVVELLPRLSALERASALGFAVGQSYIEIADAAGVDHKQVDNALQRARRKLRGVSARPLERAA